jgi:hypothetical protein
MASVVPNPTAFAAGEAATQMIPLRHHPADVDIDVDIAECRAPPAIDPFLPL